ncbi:MAG: cbb3-type cytochrome c oxidase subunit 3 [Alphaproteobacteria bacterium]|nr:cbb3-type cytochrome c oxidase subunit 3 [Alphaproteobacteria bacterium]
MTYETVAAFAQTWGLLYAAVLFGGVLAYALWPRNQAKFDRAASMPLDEEIDQ